MRRVSDDTAGEKGSWRHNDQNAIMTTYDHYSVLVIKMPAARQAGLPNDRNTIMTTCGHYLQLVIMAIPDWLISRLTEVPGASASPGEGDDKIRFMLRNESVVEMTLTNATQLSSNSIQKLI